MTSVDEMLKLFCMSNQLLEHNLDRIEREHSLDLGRGHTALITSDQAYYPQIEREIRAEAARMAPHYEVFYSLETTIRRLVGETLEAAEGPNWWASGRITPRIKQDAETRQQREIDTGLTPRSDDVLDFSTFGELSELIKTKLGPIRLALHECQGCRTRDDDAQQSPRTDRPLLAAC